MNKRYLKRIVGLLLAVLMSLLPAAAVFADGEEPGATYDEVIAIIHTNDVHGEIEVEPFVKGLADQMKSSGDYSLVLTASAGDVYSGGEAVAGYYKGELIPAIIDQVYDVIAPGNNDFNDGIQQNLLLTALYNHTKTICANLTLKDGVDMAAYLSGYQPSIGSEDFANLYDKITLKEDNSLDFTGLELSDVPAETSPWAPTAIFETSKGTKLGLFGLSCTEGQMAGRHVGPGSIQAAKNAVSALKEQNADVIVGLAHTGWMGEGNESPAQANDTNAWLLAKEVQDMDALIDSHTHLVINDGAGCYVGENEVLVNQAGSFGKCIGIMKFYLKEGKVVNKTAELLTGDAITAITPDAAVQTMVDADIARILKDVGPTLLTTPYYLNADSTPVLSARGAETNMGDFITDVILKAASETRGKTYDFTFYPGYCLRKTVEAETMMTKVDIASIISFPTPLIEQEYSAQDIVDLVTGSLQMVFPQNFKAATFFQYSGLKITYTNEGGVGTPVTIKLGDTPIYDANNGGVLVPDSWTALGVRAIDPNEGVDIATVAPEKVICGDVKAVRQLICDYLSTHTLGTDYVIYPNELAPDKRIVEIPLYHPAKEATCEEEGLSEAYWTFGTKMFADEALTTEIENVPAAIPALGHDWDNGVVTKAATTTATGIRTFTCKRCKETRTEIIPKVPKKANPLKVKVSKKTIKRAKLKKALSFSIGTTKAKGKVTYTLNKKAKKAKIKVSAKGKVTIPKKCKAGIYKITVKAAGNSTYLAGTKVITITVKK